MYYSKLQRRNKNIYRKQLCGNSYQGTSSVQWNWVARKVPPPGCPFCPSRSMDLHCAKVHSEMPCACMRYNWQPANLPNNCVCGHPFSVDHALSCPTVGFPTIRHNELRDFTAKVMTEVCHDMCLEPPLQPLTGETLRYATANTC